MFGLGMMEIGVIVILAVLLFPAKELPKLARTVARLYGQVRKTAEDFRGAVLDDEDLREPIDQIRGAYNDARFEVRDAERKARQQLAKAQMEMRMATARRLQSERIEEQKAKIAAQEANEDAADAADAAGATGATGATDAAGATDDAPAPASTESGASSAPVIAAAEPERADAQPDTEPARGPVAAIDPRKITVPSPPTYTPPASHDDPAREGVG